MNNIIKGWITTILGLAIMVVDVLFYFGVIELPEAEAVGKPMEILIAFGIGLSLFLIPATKLEEKLNKYIDKKAEK
jgi:hypothetical protein